MPSFSKIQEDFWCCACQLTVAHTHRTLGTSNRISRATQGINSRREKGTIFHGITVKQANIPCQPEAARRWEHNPHTEIHKIELQVEQLKAQAFARLDETRAGARAQLQFQAAAGGRKEGRKEGGTCGDGEDGEGEAWVRSERVEPRGGGVHRRLVGAEGGREEPPQLVAGQGGGGGVELHGG